MQKLVLDQHYLKVNIAKYLVNIKSYQQQHDTFFSWRTELLFCGLFFDEDGVDGIWSFASNWASQSFIFFSKDLSFLFSFSPFLGFLCVKLILLQYFPWPSTDWGYYARPRRRVGVCDVFPYNIIRDINIIRVINIINIINFNFIILYNFYNV